MRLVEATLSIYTHSQPLPQDLGIDDNDDNEVFQYFDQPIGNSYIFPLNLVPGNPFYLRNLTYIEDDVVIPIFNNEELPRIKVNLFDLCTYRKE